MRYVDELSVIEKTMVLSSWELFKGLATDEVAMIAAPAVEVQLEPGDFDRERTAGRSIHFVLEGKIEILVDGQVVRRAGEGQVAGSLAALDSESPTETLRVSESAHTLMLSGADFERAVADHPEFAMALIRSLIRLMRARNRGD